MRAFHRVQSVSLGILAGCSLVVMLFLGREILAPLTFAAFGAFTLFPFVELLRSVRIPHVLASLFVVALIFIGVLAIGVALIDPLKEAVAKAPGLLTEIELSTYGAFRRFVINSGNAGLAKQLAPTPQIVAHFQAAGSFVAIEIGDSIKTLLIVTVALFFFLTSGNLFLRKCVRLLPNRAGREVAVEVGLKLSRATGKYWATMFIINLGVAVVCGVVFHLIGLKDGWLWGLVAGLVNIIPLVGPIAIILLLLLLGSIQEGLTFAALAAPCAFLIVHLIESQFLTPMILGRRLTLNPILVLISLIFWIWLWGIIGALIAVPLLITLKVVADHVPSMSSVSDFLT